MDDDIMSTARALTRAALNAHAAAQAVRDDALIQPHYWTGIDRRIGPTTRRTGKHDRRAASQAHAAKPEKQKLRTKTIA